MIRGPAGAPGQGLDISDDGSELLTAGLDGTAQRWTIEGTPVGAPFEFGQNVDAIALRGQSTVLVSERLGGWAVFDAESLALLDRSVDAPRAQVSPDGRHYLGPAPDFSGGEVRRLADGELHRRLTPSDSSAPFVFAKWAGDGGSILAVTADQRLFVRDLAADEANEIDVDAVYDQVFDDGGAADAFFSPRLDQDGELLFLSMSTPDGAESAALWLQPETNDIVAGPLRLDAGGSALVLRNGAVVLAGAGAPISVLPPDLTSAPLVVVEEALNLRPLAEDPATGLVALGGGNGALAILNPSSGEVRMIQGLSGSVWGAAFSSLGDRLAVGLQPGGVQLISMETEQLIGEPMQRTGDNMDAPEMAWDADVDAVWWSADSGPQRWTADPDRWLELACQIAGRELSPAEWDAYVSSDDPQVPRCG